MPHCTLSNLLSLDPCRGVNHWVIAALVGMWPMVVGCGSGEYEQRMQDSLTRLEGASPVADDSGGSGDGSGDDFDADPFGAAGAAPENAGSGGTRAAGSGNTGGGNTGGGNSVIGGVAGAVRRSGSQQGLRQIGTALVNYASQNGRFPPQSVGSGLSWRVAILPMLDQQSLYSQFRQNEPWDSEHNRALVARMPSIYASPSIDAGEGRTVFLAVAGDDAVIAAGNGTQMRQISDGTSRTAVVVEANPDRAVVWTQPEDYRWTAGNPLAGLGQVQRGGFLAVMADGRVLTIATSAPATAIEALFRKSDGNNVSLDQILQP